MRMELVMKHSRLRRSLIFRNMTSLKSPMTRSWMAVILLHRMACLAQANDQFRKPRAQGRRGTLTTFLREEIKRQTPKLYASFAGMYRWHHKNCHSCNDGFCSSEAHLKNPKQIPEGKSSF